MDSHPPGCREQLYETRAALSRLLPGQTHGLIEDDVHQLVAGQSGGLLSSRVLAALWTSSSAFTAIIDALNCAYAVEEGLPFWNVQLIATGLAVGLSTCIIPSPVLLTLLDNAMSPRAASAPSLCR